MANQNTRKLATVVISFCAIMPLASAASVVTFETMPNGTAPMDDQELSPTEGYTLDNGVTLTFAFSDSDTGQFNVPGRLEKSGGNPDSDANRGFDTNYGTDQYDTGRDDALNQQLGEFFLRHADRQSALTITLKITYANNAGMRYASGEIWDIDGRVFPDADRREGWLVKAFSSGGTELDCVRSPNGMDPSNIQSLDALPWTFELFARQDIAYVLVAYDGGRRPNVGLAFNNFATAVTLPADFDRDFDVDGADLSVWRGAFTSTAAGDADADGESDGHDFLIWQRQWGKSVKLPSWQSVPEPTGLEIAALLLSAIRLRRVVDEHHQVAIGQ